MINSRLFCRAAMICFVALLSLSAAVAQTSDDPPLKPADAAAFAKWLKTNPAWRLATEKDYDAEALKYAREQEGAKFLPFYVAGDFNRDRKEDFAVIVTTKRGKKQYAAVVFNAPFAGKPFFYPVLQADDMVLYNRENKTLLLAPYASDNGWKLVPKKSGYLLEDILQDAQ